jgi:fatty-acyl-CoA synthase
MSESTRTFTALQATARKQPDATAIVHQEKTLTYRDLFSAASAFAAELAKAGVSRTDLVGLVGYKDIEFVIAFLAFLRRGNPIVTLSPALRPGEMAELSERLSLTALCYSEKSSAALRHGQTVTTARLPTGSGMAALEIGKLREFSDRDPKRAELARLGITSIRLSSGTTGQAKGIMISENAVWWRAECNSVMHRVTSEDCILYLVAMDLASPHLIAYFSKGAKVVVEESHNFDAIRRLSSSHRITHIHATPLFYQMMTNQPGLSRTDFSTVKLFISTGAPLPTALADVFYEKFGCEISQYYGLGECGPVFINVSNALSKRGAAGVPLPDWEISFAGGNPADPEDLGELLLRGPGLFDGYYAPWQLREEVLIDGWFRTGDLVRRDDDGYYWIVGRSKHSINIGGAKVFPWEIEDVLLSHPDVEEALVYSQSDARFGEVPHAKVKRRADSSTSERDLLRFANDRLAILKALRKVEFVSELPRTHTGKIKRSERN